MDYRYSYPTYTPTCNYPLTSKQGFHGIMETNLLLGPADAVVKTRAPCEGFKKTGTVLRGQSQPFDICTGPQLLSLSPDALFPVKLFVYQATATRQTLNSGPALNPKF